MTDICNWNQYDDEYGSYEADCGMEFELNDGTPEDNHMKFCCGCGKPISIHLLNRRCIPMSKVFEIKFETTVADSKEITVENHYWIAGSLYGATAAASRDAYEYEKDLISVREVITITQTISREQTLDAIESMKAYSVEMYPDE